MQNPHKVVLTALASTCLSVFLTACATQPTSPPDPLPSWNDNPTRQQIVEFVEAVTEPQGSAYVPPAERIAVFDNDGTLWAEQPYYFQLAFALDRVRELAPQHPEWQHQQPFAAVLANDLKTVMAAGERGLVEIIMATHAGMSTDEFNTLARAWLAEARHPATGRLYTDMVYQPMLELLDYLRANGFRTWIVSGGGVDFLRVFSVQVYGIPPEQVVGSTNASHFEMGAEGPLIMREPKIAFINDKEGKPVGIHNHIGRRPIAAFGNSDGDLQMLQWSMAGEGRRLAALVHHTDAAREWAYDRTSSVGRLDAALDQAIEHDWLVIDMARDWRNIHPAETSPD